MEKKALLKRTEIDVQQMIQDRLQKVEEIKHSVELNKASALREIEDSMRVFSELVRSIQRTQAELVLAIEEKQRKTERWAQSIMSEVEQEIAELKKKNADLENVARTDHIHFLQSFPALSTPPPVKDWSRTSVPTSMCVGILRRAVSTLEKTLNEEINKLADSEIKKIAKYTVDLTLDPDTANPWLQLSQDRRQVRHLGAWQDLPDNPDRFDTVVIALGREGFTSGRHYWEVQVGEKDDWYIGMAKSSVNRKGRISVSTTQGYWALAMKKGQEYRVSTSPPLTLTLNSNPKRVGIYVDYDEGQLSFYDVKARTHIYTFKERFTEKILPFFYLYCCDKASDIIVISSINEKALINFCLACIGEYWRIQGSCQCPLCKASFQTRPQLQIDQRLHAEDPPGCGDDTIPFRAGEVPCDICLAKHRAVKSCLMCLASYCEAHLEPHYRDEGLEHHLLVGVFKNLDGTVCRLHGKQVDRFCKSDQTCICNMCAQTDHRGHRVVSITKEAARMRMKLKRRMTKLTQKIQERLGGVENTRLSLNLKEGSEGNRSRVWTGADGLVKEMEQEITELQRTNTVLGQLYRTDNPLHLIQVDITGNNMASSSVPPNLPIDLEQYLTCSICMDVFNEPVTTACGHSFCRSCLTRNIKYNDQVCPLCKEIQRGDPKVNFVLKSLVQELNRTPGPQHAMYTGAPGEVACDVCPGRKLKAEKACLVCLVSYCSAHLKAHSSTRRLKGHKLVEPTENLDERACLTHGRPLELFNRERQRCICALCVEKSQQVVSAEEEWDMKKAELDKVKAELQQESKKREKKVDEISASLKDCEDQLDNEWWEIEAVFSAVISAVERAQEIALKPLKKKRQDVKKEAKHLTEELQREIDKLKKAISELDDIASLEDHVLFLQSYPSTTDMNAGKDCSGVALDTSFAFGTMRNITKNLMEEIQQHLDKLTYVELQRVPKFSVDVELDPNTAHAFLILSDDGKEVRDGGQKQEVPATPERFDLFCSVLGLNKLNSGRSYWEVEVGKKNGWDLGVARCDANREGKLSLNPDNGYWAVVHYDKELYAALTAPPTHLSLKVKPEKVGVFVDYKEGLVSFYDVTAGCHIYSFTGCSFTGDLYPYLSPHLKEDEKNKDPLIISPVKRC
ncbi:uncharacterized protein LOC130131006 [Lampris incognitus]|uniref:uncharacterized protein LOC130131006 n=1 Tax=Lampris incognitus TaxID=2546036 RepID=UPI0024B54727|nr:uncharacterized protein LOC130131006 [Lampris incognitus]